VFHSVDSCRPSFFAVQRPQGDLGNCWFLGALSLIAGQRNLLDNVLLSRELSPSGAYHVRLSTAGEWKTILVDDYLPCKEDGSCACVVSALPTEDGGLLVVVVVCVCVREGGRAGVFFINVYSCVVVIVRVSQCRGRNIGARVKCNMPFSQAWDPCVPTFLATASSKAAALMHCMACSLLPNTHDSRYAWGRGRQLWVPLIEKAAAMVYGSYEALQAGSIGEGLRLLSGSPCETIHLNGGLGLGRGRHSSSHGAASRGAFTAPPSSLGALSPSQSAQSLRGTAIDDVWSHVAGAHSKRQLIGASSASDTGASGIVPMHAFAVVHVWCPREGVRLLCLQNPFGRSEWTGRFALIQ
jgi:hypothetical protein